MANYPPYSYAPQQVGQPMMQPQAQPGCMPQQMQQRPPQMGQPVQPDPRYLVRPVASEMEAMAAPTPFDGSILLMTDLSHGMIYAKALNCADGTAIFSRYAAQAAVPEGPAQQYAPLDMVEQLRRDVEAMREQMAAKAPARGGRKEAAEA